MSTGYNKAVTGLTYRTLSIHDLPQAKRLWESVFDDPESFVNWYFEKRFPPNEARGIFDGNDLRCMVQAVPYRLFLRGQWVKVIYIVGLATHPHTREQGLATTLLQNLLQEYYNSGLGITILMPAVPLFYHRRGWEYAYTAQKTNFILNDSKKLSGRLEVSPAIDLYMMNKLYHQTFAAAHGRLERTEKDWQDLLYDYMMDGGTVFYYKDQNNQRRGYILGQSSSDQIKIRELAVDDGSFVADAICLLDCQFPHRTIEWQRWAGQSPPLIPLQNVEAPMAMARIVNLEVLFESIQYPSDARLDLRFSVYDPLLKHNCQTYHWHVLSGHGKLLPIPDHPSYPQYNISDLCTWVMGEPRHIPAEVERVFPKTLNYINDLF